MRLITPNGQAVTVVCNRCSLCKSNYIKDWVGRCRAEKETSLGASSITLTYGPDLETGAKDHMRSSSLVYSDSQKMFKRLRKAGFVFRYLVAGEFGSMKGRAHWHMIIFWKNKVPDHKIGERFDWKFWPYGYSFFDEVNDKSVRYVCKYIIKDVLDVNSVRSFHMSKRPPIGADYIKGVAERHVKQGLAPQAPTYWFADSRESVKVQPGELPRTRPILYYMSKATRALFIEHFLECWERAYGTNPPQSQMIEDYLDSQAAPLAAAVFEPRRYRKAPSLPHRQGSSVQFDDKLNAYYCLDVDGRRLYWSEVLSSWEKRVIGDSEAKAISEERQRLRDPEIYRRGRDGPTGPYE